jgi:hypothetical protein
VHEVAYSYCSAVQVPTDRRRYSKNVTSISAGNSAPRHWQFGPMLEPCSWVGALSRHRASAFGAGWQPTTATRVDRVSPDGILICKPLGAVLAFVAAAVLLIAHRLVSASCKHMGHRNPVLRLSPSGSVIITD